MLNTKAERSKMLYQTVSVEERLPKTNKWVTTIDSKGNHNIYRHTKHGWNLRDAKGKNSPPDNIPILYWLEKVNPRSLQKLKY